MRNSIGSISIACSTGCYLSGTDGRVFLTPWGGGENYNFTVLPNQRDSKVNVTAHKSHFLERNKKRKEKVERLVGEEGKFSHSPRFSPLPDQQWYSPEAGKVGVSPMLGGQA